MVVNCDSGRQIRKEGRIILEMAKEVFQLVTKQEVDILKVGW